MKTKNNKKVGRMAEEEKMESLLVVLLALTAGSLIAAVVVLLFKEGRIEVSPMMALVYKNLWTGGAYAIYPGTGMIVPGVHKKLVEVTLKNEPSDPPNADVIMGDGNKVEVDYVIYSQQVTDPVKAATKIEYKDRTKNINTRVLALLQGEFSKFFGKDFVVEEKNDQGKVIKKEVNKDMVSKIISETEKVVNKNLITDVENAWGIQAKIQIRMIKLPEKLIEVAGELATAETEGERIKIKALKAGVSPNLMAVADIVYDAATAFGMALKGGNK